MRVGPAAARQGASFGSSDYLSWHGNDDLPERVAYLMSHGTLGGVRAIRLPHRWLAVPVPWRVVGRRSGTSAGRGAVMPLCHKDASHVRKVEIALTKLASL